METYLLGLNPKSSSCQIGNVVEVLRKGGIAAVPTDTLYALAANVNSASAVNKVYRIKSRPSTVPLPLLLSDIADISKFASQVPKLAWDLANSFMPGSLTLVLCKSHNVPSYVSNGRETIALRVPDHWVPRMIVKRLGYPITGTSANKTGLPACSTADDIRNQIGNYVDHVIDDGTCKSGRPSTIVDVSGKHPFLLREGTVRKNEIETVCGYKIRDLERPI